MVRVKHGFTLIELLVTLGIVALLMAVLLPVLGSARETGRAVSCMSELGSMNRGFVGMMALQDQRFPDIYPAQVEDRWDVRILRYLDLDPRDRPAMACPLTDSTFGSDASAGGYTTYGINIRWRVGDPALYGVGRPMLDIVTPSTYPLFGDANADASAAPQTISEVIGFDWLPDWSVGFIHANASANFAWADGSVRPQHREVLDGPKDPDGVPLFFFIDDGPGPIAMRTLASPPSLVLAPGGS